MAKEISRVSPRALMIALYNEHSSEMLGTGTGFVVNTNVGLCLATARHCLTGRDHFTGKLGANGAIPSEVRIYHRIQEERGLFRDICLIKREFLYDKEGSPNWYEHIEYPDLFDFAFLPLTDIDGCELNVVNLKPGLIELTSSENHVKIVDGFVEEGTIDVYVSVGEQVSVVGYPFGAFTGSGIPLWTNGYISSEPDMRSHLDVQLIDCRARRGQSGGLVYLKRRGEIPTRNGDKAIISGYCYSFLGLYSGRINDQSDIGLVWPADILYPTSQSLVLGKTAKIPSERIIGGPITRLGYKSKE